MSTLVATGQITIIDTNDLPAVATAVGDGITKRFLYRGPTVTINDSTSYRVLVNPTHYSVVTGTPDVAVFVTAPEKGALLTGVSSLATIDKSHVYYSATTPTGGTYYDGDIWVDTINPQMVLYRYNGSTWVLASGSEYLTGLYTDMADDNILSRVEKPRAYIDFEAAKAEKVTLDQRVAAYGVDATAFITAYNNLYNMVVALNPPYSDMTADSAIVGTDWRTYWTAYYVQKADLLTRLASASIPKVDGIVTSTVTLLNNANAGVFTAGYATFDGYNFTTGSKLLLTGQGADDGVYTLTYLSSGGAASTTLYASSIATSSGTGSITNPSYAYQASNPTQYADITAYGTLGTYYGVFSGFSGTATGGTIYTTFDILTSDGGSVAIDYSTNGGTNWYPMGVGNFGTTGAYTDTTGSLTIASATVSGIILSDLRVRYTVSSRRHKVWNSEFGEWDYIFETTEALVHSVNFVTTATATSTWSFLNKKSVTDQSVWATTYGTVYGSRKWIATVGTGGDITALTDTGDVPTSGTGTVTSVTAGNGLTQSGTSTVNPVIDVVSHAGTAGSVGTLTITADSVGVTLGTTSTTAYPGNNPSGFSSGTVTSVTAGAGLTQSGTSTVNPTIDVVSHAGTAGSVGTLTITADSIGVNLGTTSTTAYPGNNPTGFTTNVGTVTSVTAGNGLTQSGTSTVNPTIDVVSHAGTAGSVGTLTVTADSVGVNLGTTSTTAYPGNNPTGFTTNVGTVTSVTAGAGLTQSGTSTVNPTIDVISHAGTAGSVGTLTITADSVGVNLGTTSTTAYPGNNPTGFTTNVGTVTSVAAGNGLTQSGTSTVNPTIDVVSHAGTAGSVGTLTITADSVGVNLGTTSTTAYPGNNPTGFTTNIGTVTSVTAGNGLTQSGTSTVNPTIDIVSHAGTAGSIGTLTITADSVGVNLGTTSTTAYPGNNPSGFISSATAAIPIRFYYEAWVDTADKQPLYRVQKASTITAISWYRDDATTVSGSTVFYLKKNGTTIATYGTLTIATAAAATTWTDFYTGLSIALAASDRLELVVATGNTTMMNLTIQLDITQAVS